MVAVEKSSHQRGSTRAEVVEDDANLPSRFTTGHDLAEQDDEFATRMTGSPLARHRPGQSC